MEQEQEQEHQQSEHPIRLYELMKQVFDEMDTMTPCEIRGATKVMSILADYFWELHFNRKQMLDQKAFVKTIDEIRDNLFDMMMNEPIPIQNPETQ